MVCLETSSTVAPTFDPSRPTIQTCWPCSNRPRVITLSRMPSSSVAGLSSTSTQIASVFPKSPCKINLSSIFGLCMDTDARFPARNNRCSLPCRASPRSQTDHLSKQSRLLHAAARRSEEHTSELQSLTNLVCRLLLEKKNANRNTLSHDDLDCVAHTAWTLYHKYK